MTDQLAQREDLKATEDYNIAGKTNSYSLFNNNTRIKTKKIPNTMMKAVGTLVKLSPFVVH